jgi:hypothetical protein
LILILILMLIFSEKWTGSTLLPLRMEDTHSLWSLFILCIV